MTLRALFFLGGISVLLCAAPCASAHPPEDMPWEAKRDLEYSHKNTEDTVATKPNTAVQQPETQSSKATAPKKVPTKPDPIVNADKTEKKNWFARWKEKRAAKKAAKQQQKNQ